MADTATPAGPAYRTCPLCEATCGLELTIEDGRVSKIRGDDQDVYSKGFLCPKGPGLIDLHDDPDRVRTPLIRDGDGFRPAGWDEAFAEIDRRLGPILEAGGRDATALYLGNPSAHNMEALIYGRVFAKALGTKNIFTATTVDQMPKYVSAGLMFGHQISIPVPDLDRTDYLLALGANPLASNGSLATAPDWRGRLRAIQERGGRVVVIDPRRSRTAEVADEHHFIRPGADAHFLFALANVLFAEGLIDPGPLAEHLNGVDQVEELAAPFTPEVAEAACGIAAEEIRRVARDLAAAEHAAVYGRIGTCTQEFGTLASWLVDVLNALTGNLDREGGAMFPYPAAGGSNTRGASGKGKGVTLGRWRSRVRGEAERFGELPVVCLAEEIETPGEGQVRALFTMAGNPVVSTPNAGRLRPAIEGLELMVSVDIYVNETTRHADVILPAPSAFHRSHYDLGLYQLAIRSVANYSEAVLGPDPEIQPEWHSLLRLAGIAAGQGPECDIEAFDDLVIRGLVDRDLKAADSPLAGKSAEEILGALEPRRGPERALDYMLRTGPFGDRFGDDPDGLTLQKLEDQPHGIDLGELNPRIPEVLRTPSGKVELAPEPIVEDVERLRASLARTRNGGMVMVGRRQLRSNNSWMHNVPHLVRGKETCTAHVHPSDAERLELADGALARVSSPSGQIEVEVEVTDAVMEGVISIPHGWGHDEPGVQLRVASDHAGANSNVLADETAIDPLSGNAVLNGIPVELAPVAMHEPVPAA
jgi:anaerobic selenocysteine-containing dehydrogenase